MSAPPRKSIICGLIDTPPNTTAIFSFTGSGWASACTVCPTCAASSRVGTSISARTWRGPLRGRHQRLQQRQREGGRLAGAGLRRAQHIAAAQDGGNGLRLDGGRRGIAGLFDGAYEGGNQTQ